MSIFDRYTKLRDAIRRGRMVTATKEILTRLEGTLAKSDVPALLVEPADTGELRAIMSFAAEKKMQIAVASGLKPVQVSGLEGHILVLTTRLDGSSVFASSHRSVRVEAGIPMESLAIDLARAGLRWHPLFPVPNAMSPGELYGLGWEGLRNWRGGGLCSHVRAVEWMGYDGTVYRTGADSSDEGAPDASGLVFGSRGALGIITSLDLDVEPLACRRTAALFELPDALTALQLMAELRTADPLPETVIYWGETATQILREGNDNRVSDRAVVLLSVEWGEELAGLPDAWSAYGGAITDEPAIASLWQDVFRFPRTAARLYPQRTGVRLRLSAQAVPALEEAARNVGRDFNLPVALWGTVERGHFQIWVLQPDGQPRTIRQAEELLKKLYDVAVDFGAKAAPGTVLPFGDGALWPAGEARAKLLDRCDPAGVYVPLMRG